uniref:non-specific serine/threonine protein kinase n=1 Tax=Mycena chlorophos TaxID=658473 RepID=A0ABQ0L6H7_MYCCL|nr:predicted protein [Mycena chlorophos]
MTTSNADIERRVNSHLWGYLKPLGTLQGLMSIDFWRPAPEASLGRDPYQNTLILPGPHISGHHCNIEWNGENGEACQVIVHDDSTNGTWIEYPMTGQRRRITRGKFGELRDGDVISFGLPPVMGSDYRYKFVEVARGAANPALIDDHYEAGEHLGRGSCGSVMKAQHRATGRVVAVKHINFQSTKANVFAEISALERVKHQHVMELHGFYVGPPGSCDVFIVMEYVDGVDLFDYMMKELETRLLFPAGPQFRGIPQDICRDIMYQLCHALAHIHSLGIVHRDIKPENVILRRGDHRWPYIVLADFGLSHVQRGRDMDQEICLTDITGSYPYMAPEVRDNSATGYDHYADSFSAALVMWALITLSSPWTEDRTEQNPSPDLDWNAITPELLDAEGLRMLKLMLAMDPQERISAAGALSLPWLSHHEAMYPIPDEVAQEYLGTGVF